jgi:putative radical SAM enzyme (TIGR03279 family)
LSARIDKIRTGSPADEAGIRPGDILVSINGRPVNDSFDYDYMSSDPEMDVVLARNGKQVNLSIDNPEEVDLGLEFENFLMDGPRHCANRCIFCFVDQMPPGMRESLYFKDDDERLSYLFGNYITLTNLNDDEIERIIEMNIQPVNISVHTVEPELRVSMMKNPKAGESLRYLYRLAEAGVSINCQIVLCRGINDGEHLRKSIEVLTGLWPSVRSVAVVPVGLTSFRKGLPHLEPYDRESSLEVLEIVEKADRECRRRYGCGIVYAADEFYLNAGRDVHGSRYYDGMPQIGNGVGMIASFREGFKSELRRQVKKGNLRPKKTLLVTGEAAAPMIRELAGLACGKCPGLTCDIREVKNRFFGGNVTVSGLLTGKDVFEQVPDSAGADLVLLPGNMLRQEGDITLDGVSRDEISAHFGAETVFIDTGRELARALAR